MLYRTAVHPATLELLKTILKKPALSGFCLAGGTSLALQIGHRVSVDLDLFGHRPFETQEILDELHPLSPLSIMSQSKNILVLNVQGVKVDFVNYRYPLISDPLKTEGLRLLAIPDIAAMKLAAIAGRGRKRDFYDLFFILRLYSLDDLISFYLRKFDDGSELMVARSLVYFEDADEDEEVILLEEKIRWESVKRLIREEVRKKYR
ncbi:MAG: nucleotidyl transferase AbiEii/AbiGii toxin family protein [Phaeodactylibacter sp.]|nr:nucleotidyl transferase AbiEii/AbiGii toxin family protein [Phaeodactylibacter sp.]MCB9266096.1 nucleotidyl transferase AbiEii/AbiGii toxin family protein [Lewinellaceae bacterium]MCB9289277.1 nucleotidyl transferase AbiEii/AbiGii toxin family protein [Lewinellaceae bacterium]